MPAITIMAVVDGTIACVTVEMDKLDWVSLDAARLARVDSLPHRIVEVSIGSNKGCFRQILPPLVEKRTSWWRWWESATGR